MECEDFWGSKEGRREGERSVVGSRVEAMREGERSVVGSRVEREERGVLTDQG